MPYIKQEDRTKYDGHIDKILYALDHTASDEAAGHFTYVVYRLLNRFNRRFWHRALAIGCLVCAILEIYRKEHSFYEDAKELENGRV